DGLCITALHIKRLEYSRPPSKLLCLSNSGFHTQPTPHPQPISQPTSQATNLLPPHPHTTTPSSNQSNHTDMSKPLLLPPNIPPTTTTVTPATTGVTVPLDVWAQMQHFMATFVSSLALAPSKPSLPIGTVLLSEPSPTLTPPTITPLAPEPTDQSAIKP
ncbi:hypothetical protein Pst134EA_032519, partial [Puccinia striiformis f. sp. tritici]|uniref:uncharacterized protein n=1 Tax=Puccinia striiformis f. sp. tritici TaxID=168172 RepID=UPI002008AD83